MKLLPRRTQRSGMLGGKVIFALDARIEPTGEEVALIQKYRLGGLVVYSSKNARKFANAAVDSANRGGLMGFAKAAASLAAATLSAPSTASPAASTSSARTSMS